MSLYSWYHRRVDLQGGWLKKGKICFIGGFQEVEGLNKVTLGGVIKSPGDLQRLLVGNDCERIDLNKVGVKK